MTDPTVTPAPPVPPRRETSREARLAAKLRENLHRRKAQARALDSGESSATLSKPDPSR